MTAVSVILATTRYRIAGDAHRHPRPSVNAPSTRTTAPCEIEAAAPPPPRLPARIAGWIALLGFSPTQRDDRQTSIRAGFHARRRRTGAGSHNRASRARRQVVRAPERKPAAAAWQAQLPRADATRLSYRACRLPIPQLRPGCPRHEKQQSWPGGPTGVPHEGRVVKRLRLVTDGVVLDAGVCSRRGCTGSLPWTLRAAR
ncbi:hypothetical protein FA95DRAFT_952226 [Auriscalpium vulgare]|uniref:Uncharacterized protein n=1 Tax=Auriscalpium vulgare TaxID=40419 RepID=A0ACB8R7Y3_9AGAM|nr:hypothetical protein FA95DRAFT_952226 [Auriscalpium vulgare]